MPVFELETPEAMYMQDGERNGHFSINCVCKGENGLYRGLVIETREKFLKDVWMSIFL